MNLLTPIKLIVSYLLHKTTKLVLWDDIATEVLIAASSQQSPPPPQQSLHYCLPESEKEWEEVIAIPGRQTPGAISLSF